MTVTRIRQGLLALFAWTTPVDEAQAARVLSPALLALFRQMRRSERLHSLNVLRTLQDRGHNHPALLTAALLHDVGKINAPFHLWDRVIVVLVGELLPGRSQQWGEGAPRGWRRPFAIRAQHPRWGAELAAAAGADPMAVELIGLHQRHLDGPPRTELEHLLAALQAADDAN